MKFLFNLVIVTLISCFSIILNGFLIKSGINLTFFLYCTAGTINGIIISKDYFKKEEKSQNGSKNQRL